MLKGKYVVLSLFVAAIMSWQMMPASVHVANSGIVDGESSSAWVNYAPGADTCLFICPLGDGSTLLEHANTIGVTVKDNTGAPIVGIPATDGWLDGATDLILCGGSISSNMFQATDATGWSEFRGTIDGGGNDTGLVVYIQGTVIVTGGSPVVLPIPVVSLDVNADNFINVVDIGIWGPLYPWPDLLNPGKVYNWIADLNCDQNINVIDVGIVGEHWPSLADPTNHDCPF